MDGVHAKQLTKVANHTHERLLQRDRRKNHTSLAETVAIEVLRISKGRKRMQVKQ